MAINLTSESLATFNGLASQLQYYDNFIYANNAFSNTQNLNKYNSTNGNATLITNVPNNSAIAVTNTGIIYTATNSTGTLYRIISGTSTELSAPSPAISITNLLYYSPSILYAVTANVSTGIIIKITGVDTGTPNYNVPFFECPTNSFFKSITTDNTYIYAIVPSNNLIYKINISVPTTYTTINLPYTHTNEGLCYSNGFLYFAYGTSSQSIKRYNLATSLVDTNFNMTCNYDGYSIVIDNDEYVYWTDITGLFKSSGSTYCFNKGTKILYMNKQLEDKYIRIELLKIGDFVKTYKHGYRKVNQLITGSFRNNPKKWNMCMYKMAKTDDNGLIEDLIVTGGHSILVDTISDEEQKKYDEMGLTKFSNETIDNKQLLLSCVSDQFTALQDTGRYNYYHLLLENNDDEEERFGIWANGILTETPNVKTIKS